MPETPTDVARNAALMAVSHVEALVTGDEDMARATMPQTIDEATTQATVLAAILADICRTFGEVGERHLRLTRAALLTIPEQGGNTDD